MIVSLAILANTASVALQSDNFELAIWLNPLNTDARVNLSDAYLKKKHVKNNLYIYNVIQRGKEYSAIDARLFSLDGVYQKKYGSTEKAQKLFSTSLAILPTEYQALIHKFKHYLEVKKYVKALDIINVITKRWPKRQNSFSTFIPLILLNTIAYEHATKLFTNSESIRLLLISSLVKNPVTTQLAINLIQTWKDTTGDNIWNLGNIVTKKLFLSKKYNTANLAFKAFLNRKQRDNYHFIYNGDFSLPFLKNSFDWAFRNQVGVFHTVKESHSKHIKKENKTYLEIRFSNKPIQYRNVSQYLKLAPGSYKISVDYFTKSLKTPKPIKMSIDCIRSNKRLTTLVFKSGNHDQIQSSAVFDFPVDECDISQIFLHTEFLAKSWRNRFSGILGINNISIDLVVDNNDK